MAAAKSDSDIDSSISCSSWDFGYVKCALDDIDQLNDVESLNDPEELPYKSKYAARELLETLRKRLDTFVEAHSQNSECDDEMVLAQAGLVAEQQLNDLQTQKAVSIEGINIDLDPPVQSSPNVDFPSQQIDNLEDTNTAITAISKVEIFLRYIEGKLGINFIECEENSSGEEHLNRALQCLTSKFHSITPWTAYVHVYLLNQIGILQASRRQNDKAAKALHQSEETYETYKSKYSQAPMFPMDLLTSFSGTADENDEASKWKLFEMEHTQTLYYLAQVYQKAEDGGKASHYCQITLKRQLEMKQYDPIDWALNAATLSQYYVTENDFSLARHCLASAMKIFEECGPCEPSDEEGGLFSKSLDIKRCWVKYGLVLLELSWVRLVSDAMQDYADADEEKNADFFDLELTHYENWMPNKYVLDFDQARPVFLKIQEFITEAKKFYTIDSFCSDYIELVQDHSQAFKHLSVFESDTARKSKMHKRRADMLEEVTRELNPQYYLLVWRQLVYETAEVYSVMVDCKVEIMNESQERPSAAVVSKINALCEKSIHKYLEYVGSLKTPDGQLPDPLPEGDERPALVAWFCIARLYYKMIKVDPAELVECVTKTLMYYKSVVDSCDKNPSYAKLMEAELPVCREMVSLLPVKIDKLIAQAQQ